MRIFVVAGSPQAEPPQRLAPAAGDRVITADRGAEHARSWGWPVHLVVGDLDSLPDGLAAKLRAADTPILTAPVAKDETDLELALAQALAWAGRPGGARTALEARLRGPWAQPGQRQSNVAEARLAVHGPVEIVICAALGGRADHMLANILLLAKPELAGRQVMIAQGAQTIRLLRGEQPSGPAEGGEGSGDEPALLALSGGPGDLLSLLPVGGDAVGVTTANLAYPLRDETLYLGQPRGMSNVFNASSARVWLRAGMLLVVHTFV